MDTDLSFAVLKLSIPNQLMDSQPFFDFCLRLLHEGPHRQTINKAARPSFAMVGIGVSDPVPEPRKHDSSSFPKAGGDVDELRTAICPIIATGKVLLEAEWAMSRCFLKENTVSTRVHQPFEVGNRQEKKAG
jgi:hypothetical protein